MIYCFIFWNVEFYEDCCIVKDIIGYYDKNSFIELRGMKVNRNKFKREREEGDWSLILLFGDFMILDYFRVE